MKEHVVGEKVIVVGMGKSGLSAATLLSQEGADITVIDDQERTPPASLPASIQFKLGNWQENDLLTSNLIVISPGFPISKLPLSRLAEKNIPVMSEIELAASRIKAPIIGITGTNGKSTTTTLVGHILKDWGLNVFVGGNLGLPLSEAVSSKWDFVVAELSSFQLETITHFRPRIGALLNITPDHLDRYPDFTAYQQTKQRIFENQKAEDHAIYNLDDPLTLPSNRQSTLVGFSKNKLIDKGVFLNNGMIESTIWGEAETVCPLNELQPGPAVHIENFLAATAITQICGCATEGIAKTLRAFKGLPHRMELIRSVNGVQYLNDSKGTNAGALMQSLQRLTAPVVLIAGGRDKSADFTPLRSIMRQKVKHLILVGEAGEVMAQCFSELPSIRVVDTKDGMKSIQEAVKLASDAAKPGDTVLLSPGCASFDQFQNYEERGDTFKKVVQQLK